MADSAKSPAPESPTTVRPLEMDDDDLQDGDELKSSTPTTTTATTATSTNNHHNIKVNTFTSTANYQAPYAASVSPVSDSPAASITNPRSPSSTDEVPPAKPPRPMTETQKNEQLLKEAFPSVDGPVIKAVLVASGGNVDRAFHALLQMTDPDAVEEEPAPAAVPPPQPPRPSGLRKYMTQLEADEQYARELAARYERRAHDQQAEARNTQRGQEHGNDLFDRDHSFLDDDLPVIKENLRKGFLETQTKVNSWITTMKKKLDEALDEDEGESSQKPLGLGYGRRPGGGPNRRSGDYERYDADPQVITDDFAGMKLTADGTPVRDSSLRSPLANSNPNVFRPPPPQKSPIGRKVAFREEIDEIEPFSPTHSNGGATITLGSAVGSTSINTAAAAKASKWQPLSPAELTPVGDNDPFTLGDSDDERDHAPQDKDKKESKGIQMDDLEGDEAERMRKAAAEAMEECLVEDKGAKKV